MRRDDQIPAVEGELRARIVDRLNAGASRADVVRELARRGFSPKSTGAYVDSVLKAGTREQVSTSSLFLAAVGGLAGAIVGGIAWGFLAQAMGQEWGVMATGVGLLAGVGVALAARGKRGTPFQAIGASSSVLGMLAGKYFSFVQIGQDFFEEELGPGADAALPLFSGATFSFFLDSIGELFSGFDLLWVALAVYAAWRIPQGIGLRRQPRSTPFG